MNKKQRKSLIQIIIAAVLLVVLALLPIGELWDGALAFFLYMIPYLVVGFDILRRAVKNISHGQVFDENFLMAVATIGAIALGEYREGVAVMLFYQIGELFQSYAVGKSRRNISELMDIRPDYANLETGEGENETVDPDDVEIGSVILVKPGEKIPIDGEVIEGESLLDTAALTGESLPRSVGIGDPVLSGCINKSGVLRIRTTAEFGESTASKILELVENASSRKSRSENFISKFAKYYTPVVCYSALALFLLPPLARMLFFQLSPAWGTYLYRALTFLVISCPCALVISIPLSFFAGLGGASNQGILIKGSNYLETLSQVKTVVFDKTGTLTQGNFAVTQVCILDVAALPENGGEEAVKKEQDAFRATQGLSSEEAVVFFRPADAELLLKYAAHLECFSTHPIAQSLKDAYSGKEQGRELNAALVSDVEEIGGHGLVGVVDGHRVAAGNRKLMELPGILQDRGGAEKTPREESRDDVPKGAAAEASGEASVRASALKMPGEPSPWTFAEGISKGVLVPAAAMPGEIASQMSGSGLPDVSAAAAGTVVYVAIDGRLAGYVVISDEVKETSNAAVKALRNAGVQKTVMLTGDNEVVAEAVAGALGIDEVHAGLLPEDKVAKVEELLGEGGAGFTDGAAYAAADKEMRASSEALKNVDTNTAGDKNRSAIGAAENGGKSRPAKNFRRAKLAFVGDGINDAPVLSRADLGIAMGALGSDAAIEAADVVLMDDDPVKIAKAIRIAKKCMRIVYENIWFAIGIKLFCLLLGALGIANMWVAIFADVGVMVLAVLNAMRTLFVKNL